MTSQDLRVSTCGERRTIGWSIERQVRIVSGLLILVGIGLAYVVYPPFIWLSVVVALGMIVSGVSDSCALVFFVSQLPWNRERTSVDRPD
ncbi:MAG: DUF2892 domain-containing protein [Candidatus Obscuribacterales bacterium]|nr:DUF2892 domain-containing protein [Candidatus Obscuribacterales bacterium]